MSNTIVVCERRSVHQITITFESHAIVALLFWYRMPLILVQMKKKTRNAVGSTRKEIMMSRNDLMR